MENLNLRGDYKTVILDYISQKYPDFIPLYNDIYKRKKREYWQTLELEMRNYANKHGYDYVDNYLPDGRSPKGKPTIVNYLYHEEIRGSQNTGKRKGK